jgi:FkbM family methyltransferase
MSPKALVYATLARPVLQPLYRRLTGYLLRVQGYNNYPTRGGAIDTGEDWVIRRLLPADIRVCLDVGANRGSYATAILQHTAATVYAVEPIPEMAALATAATQRWADRCHVITCALSDRPGTTRLRYRRDRTETASLSPLVGERVYDADVEIDVAVSTVDHLVAEHKLDRVDLIKLDVEGLELACLRGARQTIETLRPAFVQVEMNWHHLFSGITLHSLHALLPGYRVVRLLPRGVVDVHSDSTLDNLFALSNYLFCRDAVTSSDPG